jgi:hypothetical protein
MRKVLREKSYHPERNYNFMIGYLIILGRQPVMLPNNRLASWHDEVRVPTTELLLL